MMRAAIRPAGSAMADETKISPSRGLERRLATILSADVAEFSRLMAEDEEQTLVTFRAHKEVFEALVALHRGRVFNTAGDAILAEFASAVEAVRCATEIQAALRTRNDQTPAARQVRFRIGVNLGDVMVEGTDLLGDGVNVAARLQSAAEPGGICVSGSVYDQIRNKLSLSFKSLGDQVFKNIPQPVRTFSITETESGGALPSPSVARRVSFGRGLAGVTIAVLLLAAGVGYWSYSSGERAKAEQTRLLAESENAKREATRQEQAAEDARRRAELEREAAEVARREAQLAARQRAEANKRQAAEATGRSTPGTDLDGLYAGPICYGPGRNDAPRCFRAEAKVSDGKIIGGWPGRDPAKKMVLTGDVAASGAVQIEMYSEDVEGAQLTTIKLTGTLHDGRLDATGSFANGRKATVSWQRQ
jgi:class 3 adenylate cyclase